jgi:hypothetical protein
VLRGGIVAGGEGVTPVEITGVGAGAFAGCEEEEPY